MSSLTNLLCLLCFSLCAWVGWSESKYEILKEDWCGEASCYDVLGVSPLDDRRTIKTRYNNLSMELHPDKNPNATDAEKALYVRVNKAYEILSNSQLRDKYDEYLKLKSSLDSPRENIVFVLILLYLLVVFIVLQYQKQNHNRLRKGILELPAVQQWLQRKKNIDITGSKSKKKMKRARGKKGGKTGKKGNGNNESEGGTSLSSLFEEEEDSSTSWMDQIDNDMINQVLNDLNTVVPGWTGNEPTFAQALFDVPMFIFNKSGDAFFFAKWHLQHTLLGNELNDNEREEMCRRHFQKSHTEWKEMDAQERNKYMQRPGPWKTDKDKKKKKKN